MENNVEDTDSKNRQSRKNVGMGKKLQVKLPLIVKQLKSFWVSFIFKFTLGILNLKLMNDVFVMFIGG